MVLDGPIRRTWRGTLIEPTVLVVAPTRGGGYEQFGSDWALFSLTHYRNPTR